MLRGTLIAVLLLAGVTAGWAAGLKVIQTATTKDLTVTLLSENGQWRQGPNSFVLEFASASTHQPVDVGKVALNASMSMPGMAPMVNGATVAPAAPGRYRGAIVFPDSGARQVTIAWDGPAGKGSTKLSVPVR